MIEHILVDIALQNFPLISLDGGQGLQNFKGLCAYSWVVLPLLLGVDGLTLAKRRVIFFPFTANSGGLVRPLFCVVCFLLLLFAGLLDVLGLEVLFVSLLDPHPGLFFLLSDLFQVFAVVFLHFLRGGHASPGVVLLDYFGNPVDEEVPEAL